MAKVTRRSHQLYIQRQKEIKPKGILKIAGRGFGQRHLPPIDQHRPGKEEIEGFLAALRPKDTPGISISWPPAPAQP